MSIYFIWSTTRKKANDKEEEKDIYELVNNNFIEIIISDKLFLEKDLTLRKTAKRIGTNEKYLSYAINKIHNESFSTIINNFRVEYAKSLLKDSEYANLTIETIGNMSGFNSKSSFNSVFKKTTGITPSEFKLKKD
jgi:YesN/AraC family two-component response regulator